MVDGQHLSNPSLGSAPSSGSSFEKKRRRQPFRIALGGHVLAPDGQGFGHGSRASSITISSAIATSTVMVGTNLGLHQTEARRH
jgi:hypothetical protein